MGVFMGFVAELTVTNLACGIFVYCIAGLCFWDRMALILSNRL